MRYMMLVTATKNWEAGVQPDPKFVAAMGQLAAEAIKAGKMLDMGGLLPSSKATRVRAGGGKVSIIDGPFAETKELIGGYAIFNLESKEEAVKIGRDFMQLHIDFLGPSYEGQLEIRPMTDAPPIANKS